MQSFLKAPAAALVAAGILMGLSTTALADEYAPFNTRVGTQTFVPGYQFEFGKDKLQETAERIDELGSSILKFELSERVDSTYDLNMTGIGTLTELVRDQATVANVLAMDFDTYMMWMFPLTVDSLNNHFRGVNGYTTTEQTDEYNEIYDLVVYLRQTFDGTGKTFYLGHWEGDHAIKGTTDFGTNASQTDVDQAILWLNNRQQAVNDARAATPTSDVNVYHYAEVNIVIDDLYNPGRNSMVGEVLPNLDVATRIDAVSYSSYDSATVPPGSPAFPGEFRNALNHIKNTLSGKTSGLLSDYVFVGEHGYTSAQFNEAQAAERAEAVIEESVDFGCPFVLYWQMYNNEVGDEFWLVDDSNQKVAAWEVHQDFLARANALKNVTRTWLARNPTDAEFEAFAADAAAFSTSSQLDAILDSAEYDSLLTDAEYVDYLYEVLLKEDSPSGTEYNALISALGSGTARSAVLDDFLDGADYAGGVDDDRFVQKLFEETLQDSTVGPGDAEYQTVIGRLSAEDRSAIWREFIDLDAFYLAELPIRSIDDKDSAVVLGKMLPPVSIGELSNVGNNWILYQ